MLIGKISWLGVLSRQSWSAYISVVATDDL